MTLYSMLEMWRAKSGAVVGSATRNVVVFQKTDSGKEEYLMSFSYQRLEQMSRYITPDLLGCRVVRFCFTQTWTMEAVIDVDS